MEPASAAGIQARKGSSRVASAVPIAAADPADSTNAVPRGSGNPSSPDQPQEMTPAAKATARATSTGPAAAAAARVSARVSERVGGGGSGMASVTCGILPSPAANDGDAGQANWATPHTGIS